MPARHLVMLAVLSLGAGCRSESGSASTAPAPSASAQAAPSLASRYQTPWGTLGWERRVHDTVTFTNEGKSFFLHCTVRSTFPINCRWSKENPADPGGWDRGKAQLRYQPNRTLVGTWGHGDSDADAGPCELRPLPRS